jgi:hypothetical protein
MERLFCFGAHALTGCSWLTADPLVLLSSRDSLAITRYHCQLLAIGRAVKLLLALANTVILGFEHRRDRLSLGCHSLGSIRTL